MEQFISPSWACVTRPLLAVLSGILNIVVFGELLEDLAPRGCSKIMDIVDPSSLAMILGTP